MGGVRAEERQRERFAPRRQARQGESLEGQALRKAGNWSLGLGCGGVERGRGRDTRAPRESSSKGTSEDEGSDGGLLSRRGAEGS